MILCVFARNIICTEDAGAAAGADGGTAAGGDDTAGGGDTAGGDDGAGGGGEDAARPQSQHRLECYLQKYRVLKIPE